MHVRPWPCSVIDSVVYSVWRGLDKLMVHDTITMVRWGMDRSDGVSTVSEAKMWLNNAWEAFSHVQNWLWVSWIKLLAWGPRIYDSARIFTSSLVTPFPNGMVELHVIRDGCESSCWTRHLSIRSWTWVIFVSVLCSGLPNMLLMQHTIGSGLGNNDMGRL